MVSQTILTLVPKRDDSQLDRRRFGGGHDLMLGDELARHQVAERAVWWGLTFRSCWSWSSKAIDLGVGARSSDGSGGRDELGREQGQIRGLHVGYECVTQLALSPEQDIEAPRRRTIDLDASY
jgi:hypothetical protein